VLFFIFCFINSLTGVTPFYAQNYNQVIHLNKECNINFDRNYWSRVSEEAKELCKLLLKKKDPNERPSADIALKHKWFDNSTRELKPLDNVVENMSRYMFNN